MFFGISKCSVIFFCKNVAFLCGSMCEMIKCHVSISTYMKFCVHLP